MKAVILCGGREVHLGPGGEKINKALALAGGEPMFGHVIRMFARAGFKDFILACGVQAAKFKPALERFRAPQGCRIQVVDTGEASMTGERVRRLREQLEDSPSFAVTYSDTVSDVDLARVRAFHEGHGKLGTLVATDLPTRFRVIGLRYGETTVRGFATKPVLLNDHINGGFYFFRREALSRPYWAPGSVLETAVLEGLVKEQQLEAYPFRDGVWQHLDSERDLATIDGIVQSWSR
jgi:glucose-1-phosphate cytidylyltransferase